MRALVVSDIHSNLTALDAVLNDAPNFDAVWCLGDLVGYGPDPNECIERLRSLPNLHCLIGNHDQAALLMIPLSRFNENARMVASWSHELLSEENSAFLRSLSPLSAIHGFTLAHGSPSQPVWEYIIHPDTADQNFEALETDYCIVGHSHLPMIFHRPSMDVPCTVVPVSWGEPQALAPRMILNPGSVGQPRDMDPRAAYAILDLEANTWEGHRVAYAIGEVQQRMLAARLPLRLALRLVAGW